MSKIIEKIKSGVKEINQIYREKTFNPYIVEKQANEIEFKFLIGALRGEKWYAKGIESESSQAEEENKKGRCTIRG